MRRIVLPLLAACALAVASPAYAGGSLPTLATLHVGNRMVTIQGDSPMAVTGSNVFMIDVSDWVEGTKVDLSLVGPGGQSIPLTLRPVRVLGGSADADGSSHGSADHEGRTVPAPATPTGHDGMNMPGMSGGSHAAPPPPAVNDHAAQDHAVQDPAAHTLRSKVSLPTAGLWQVNLQIHEPGKPAVSAGASLEVESGGPQPLYLAGTGLLMGAAVLYGAVQKRRLSKTRRG